MSEEIEEEDELHRRVFKRRKPPSQHKKRGATAKPITTERICTKCKEAKPIGDFQILRNVNNPRKLGDFRSYCKVCENRQNVKFIRLRRLRKLSATELQEELRRAIAEAEHIRQVIAERE